VKEKKRRSIVGTDEYLCPELLLKHGYGKKCDIWCLGVLCYEFLVGYSPFWAQDDWALHENIKRVKYEYPSEIKISELAKDFIGKILVKNPNERVDLNQILNHNWISKQANKDDSYMRYSEFDPKN
jgi:serine/threonine protein kinase